MNKINNPVTKSKFFDSGFEDADNYADIQGLVVSLEVQQNLKGLCLARENIYKEIVLEKNDALLEIGCGLGATSREIAERFPGRELVAIDKSRALLNQAIKRSAAAPYENIRFAEGDVNSLQYPNDYFKFAYAERVLMHVKDPMLALSEMVRVLKPGGKIAITEPDLTSVKFYPNTHNISQQLASKWCEFTESPTIGVHIQQYLQKLGLINIQVTGQTVTVQNLDELNRIRNIDKLIVALVGEGQVGEKEAKEYQENLRKASGAGSFMYYVTVFTVIGQKK